MIITSYCFIVFIIIIIVINDNEPKVSFEVGGKLFI